jgi:hypothetical protein
MAAAHVQVTTTVKQADVPADAVSNNLYFLTNATPGAQDYQDLAQHVADTLFSKTGFGGSTPWTYYSGRGGDIRVYDLADPKPRPVKGHVTYIPTTWSSAVLGPRMLALCLSYYAGRNLPHSRGRIYLGPFTSGDAGETPPPDLLTKMQDLAHGLSGIALKPTISWQHATHSTVTGLTQVVTNWWANDVWDVQHSREHVETVRMKYP